MPTLTAQIILDQNNYSVYAAGPPATGDFTLIAVEYMIDSAINYIRAQSHTTISNLSGNAGSKTVTITEDQEATFSPLIACTLRENKKSQLSNSGSTNSANSNASSIGIGVMNMSESASVGSAISAASAINNPANTIYRDMVKDGIRALIGRHTYLA